MNKSFRNHSFRALGATLALAAITACSDSPVEPGLLGFSPDAGQGRTVKMVPFKAHHTARPADASDVICPPGQLAGKTSFEGTATHLGKYTGEAFACFFFTSPVTLQSASGELLLIAANGDELRLVGDPANPALWVFDPAAAVLTSVGGLNVAGGTGRFDGATGYVTLSTRRENFPVNIFSESTMEGMISSPGSIKWGNP